MRCHQLAMADSRRQSAAEWSATIRGAVPCGKSAVASTLLSCGGETWPGGSGTRPVA